MLANPSFHAPSLTMNTRIVAPLIFILATFCGSAQAWDWGWGKGVAGSGNIKTEGRAVSGFSTISLNLPATVELRQGETESLTIETDDNLLPLIETVVEDGKLKLRPMERNANFKTKTMKIVVNFKNIEALSVAGSGDFRADGLKTTALKSSIAGSGDIRIKSLSADLLKISIAGSGDFMASGKANTVESSIAGSGNLRTGKLEAKNVKVSVAGSGDATVWATQSLKVSVAGSGDIKYYGDAAVTHSVAGSGSITRLGAAPAAQ